MKRISWICLLVAAALFMVALPIRAGQSQSEAPLLTVSIPTVAVEPGAQGVDVPVILTVPEGSPIGISCFSLGISYDPVITCDQVTFPLAANWDDITSPVKNVDDVTYVHFLGWADLGGEDNAPLIVTSQPVVLAIIHFTFTDQHPSTINLAYADDDRAGTSFGDQTGSVDYRLRLEPGAIVFNPTGIDDPQKLPQEFSLAQNYPNPFNARTTIHFAVPSACHVSLAIYNILGQEVASLFNEQAAPGYYSVNWNANDVPSGIYFYRVTAGADQTTKRLLLLK